MALMASTIGSKFVPPKVIGEDQSSARTKYSARNSIGFKPLVAIERSLTYTYKKRNAFLICAAALNATCAEGQTQTVTRESSTITVAPARETLKSPELDDGGTGLPPRDDDNGGGGGGGGGGNYYSGGFFLFAFVALLSLFKDEDNEGGSSYEAQKRRRRRRYEENVLSQKNS